MKDIENGKEKGKLKDKLKDKERDTEIDKEEEKGRQRERYKEIEIGKRGSIFNFCTNCYESKLQCNEAVTNWCAALQLLYVASGWGKKE